MFFKDIFATLSNPQRWIFTTWFKFLTRYRRTIIGPFWIIASPIIFISFLGLLFVGLSGFTTSEFIPHLSIGFISWTLIGGYLLRSHSVFARNKPFLMQGDVSLTDIIIFDNSELIVHFLHQTIIIVFICFFYKTVSSFYFLVSFVGLLCIAYAGVCISLIFGVLGARYKDFGELIGSITSIAFLATPIIWMPKSGAGAPNAKAGILEMYMKFNPFYHFLEVFRAPLLGNEISPFTWMVVASSCLVLTITAALFYRKLRHMVRVWI